MVFVPEWPWVEEGINERKALGREKRHSSERMRHLNARRKENSLCRLGSIKKKAFAGVYGLIIG